MAFGLLTVLVVLSAAYVGRISHLFTTDGAERAPLVWSVVPPLAVLGLTAVLLGLQPALSMRRRGLAAVPADSPGAARLAALAQLAGLRRAPALVWDSRDQSSDALAFGRPGRYCVRVSPALLGAARRRLASFDVVVLHELAHVRGHDVGMTYAAIYSWYVLVPVLAVPPVLGMITGDLSLVPDYLARVGLLAGLVYAVRAYLLRRREHEADVRAAGWLRGPARYAALLTAPASRRAGWRHPTWLALHPSVDRRRVVVLAPHLLARPSVPALLSAGLTVGAGLSLLKESLVALPGWGPDDASRGAATILCALLGVAVAAEVLRWADSDRRSRTTALVAPAVALACGMALGALVSLTGAGISWEWGLWQDAGSAGLTGVLVAGVAVLGADLVAALRSRVGPFSGGVIAAGIVAGAALVGVLAHAAAPVVTLVVTGQGAEVISFLDGVVMGSWSPMALALGLLACAALCMRRAGWRPALTAGLGGGVLAGIGCLLVRMRLGPLDSDVLAWHFVTWSVGLVVLVAVAVAMAVTWAVEGAAGVLAGALAVTVGTVGLVLVIVALEGSIELSHMLRLIAPIAAGLGAPAMAAAVVARRSPGPRRSTVIVVLASALAVLVAGAVWLA